MNNRVRFVSQKVFSIFTIISFTLMPASPAMLGFSFASASTAVFSDGFENTPAFTNPAWDLVDPQWQVSSGSAHLGSKKAQVAGNTNQPSHTGDDVLLRTQSTLGYENLILSYWYKAESLESSDDDRVDVEWTEDGSVWHTLFSIVDGLDNNQWKEKVHVLPAGANSNPDFAFRFRAKLDNGNDKVRIDDVLLRMVSAPAENPELGTSCGLDIALVMDSSGSIGGNMGVMKTAFKDFVDSFIPATQTRFSVVDFDNTASVLLQFSNDASLIKSKIDLPSAGGATNWEDGLLKAQSTFDSGRADHPDLVVFASDGNPTVNNDSGATTGETDGDDLYDAIEAANAIKAEGTRIIALGITGNKGLDVDNLEAISSADAVYTSDFDDLASTLAALADDLCGGTITIRKLVDGVPAEGWTFDISGSPTDPDPVTTGSDGYTASVEVEQGVYAVTETLQDGFYFESASCAIGDTAAGISGEGVVSAIEVGSSDIVNCVFENNSNQAPTITLLGDNPVALVVNIDSYVEPGYSASDLEDGDLTPDVVVGGSVDTSTVGAYFLTYDVSDSMGAPATQVTRTVNVIAGDNQCNDIEDNDGDGLADYPEDPGCQSIDDTSENEPPVITVETEIVQLSLHSVMPNLLNGVSANDPEDGDITGDIVTGGDTIDTGVIDDYIVTYDVTDDEGAAAAQKTRTYQVRAQCGDGRDNDGDGLGDENDSGCWSDPNDPETYNPSDNDENTVPEIELIGLSLVSIPAGSSYEDDGAVAHDDEDGDVPLTGSGSVDTNTPGEYLITYDYTDQDGASAETVTRTVIVEPYPDCSDGQDNDEDGRVDADDPGCWEDPNDPETYDSNDNNEGNEPQDVCSNIDGIQTSVPEGLVESDGACVEPEPQPEPQPQPEPEPEDDEPEDNGGNGGGGGGGGGGGTIFETSGEPLGAPGFGGGSGGGQILGASTGPITAPQILGEELCADILLTDYLRMGWRNNPDQVTKLQNFLNNYMTAGLPLTGYFGPLTHAAVKAFQVREQANVLQPWVGATGSIDPTGTGYVYKTTKRWINLLHCANLDIPMPQLP